MGYKVSDGKTFDATAPAAQVINDGDLYRIGGWNGIAIGAKDGTQTDRTMSFEMRSGSHLQRSWYLRASHPLSRVAISIGPPTTQRHSSAVTRTWRLQVPQDSARAARC
jgi:hypothetical protein